MGVMPIAPSLIVALVGEPGCGKVAAARHLEERTGFRRVGFTDRINAMLRVGLNLTDLQLDGDAKHTPLDEMGGVTPVHLKQTLGYEWGRVRVHSDVWVNLWKADVLALAGQGIVVDDIRFANEASAVRALGGTVIRIERPGISRPERASDRHARDIACDTTVVNDKGLGDLYRSLERAIDRARRSPAVAA
ncbi:hypothetical protein UFOVP1040_62 [uncultured Caudovirales phage]|uniref:Uncharacterized protein n=1 Tax=uncultured Caudovirales phage TaxID=2100421 RepID=A0A6J5QH56_9CAUD|nr:hypothetical protein UFOVP1040_62 [uncultured Caudovirales phage]